MRPALFALVGVSFLAHWVIADPSYDVSETQDDWPYVLGFSAAIGSLAIALPLCGKLVGGRGVFRVSLVPAAGAALDSVANIFEDGLGMEWVFFVFVLGSAIMLLGLLALTIVTAYVGHGAYRLLALVPAGTMLGIIAYVVAGGPILLVTWLGAAVVALALPARQTAQPSRAAQ